MPLMNRTKHRGPTVVTHEVGDKPGMSCRNAMNRKYMLATLVNCWNRLTGRKLSTVYLAVLMLLPGNPRGSNNPSLVQKRRNDPPGYCMKKTGAWHRCFLSTVFDGDSLFCVADRWQCIGQETTKATIIKSGDCSVFLGSY